MLGMTTVIEELLMATVLSQKVSLPRKSKMDWALMALSVLLGCAGVFLSILALERFFEARYPLDTATLLSAAIVLTISFLILLATDGFRNRRVPPPDVKHHEFEKSLHTLLESIYNELEGPVRESPKMAVLLASLAGFIAAQRRV